MLNRKLGDFSWNSPWIILYLKRPRKLASLFKRLRNVLPWSVSRFRFLFHYLSQTIRSSTVTGSSSSVCYNDPRKCKCKFTLYGGIPIFWTSKRNENCMVQNIGEFEKSGVKLQCSTEERNRLLAQVIAGGSKKWGFEKSGSHCIQQQQQQQQILFQPELEIYILFFLE